MRYAVLELLTTAPVDELTTQQAADMLGLSRPTIVKLLDSGELRCRRTSMTGHRRIPRSAVKAHIRTMIDQRRQALEDILATSDELGFHDD